LRVAAYSSAVNRPLHVPAPNPSSTSPTEETDEYETLRQGSSIQHFYDKLLLIKDRLKVCLPVFRRGYVCGVGMTERSGFGVSVDAYGEERGREKTPDCESASFILVLNDDIAVDR
jgi:hypothetical protein